MLQLHTLVPALGASTQSTTLHGAWWVVLAVVVFAFVTPIAYLLGHDGGGSVPRR